MMDVKRVFPILGAFFLGSWLSNAHIIHTTSVLLKEASATLILAASSLAGVGFFLILRLLGGGARPQMAGWLLLPGWVALQALPHFFPEHPLLPALTALLWGEIVKWHLYSQVFLRWGPMSASRILSYAVLAYESGTVAAALFPFQGAAGLEIVALLPLFAVMLVAKQEQEEAEHVAVGSVPATSSPLVGWLIGVGLIAGFLRVSADTGFKFGVRLQGGDPKEWVSNFYLMSAGFTLALGLGRRLRWMAPRMGCPQRSLAATGWVQAAFALAFVSGHPLALVAAAALQRSMDKIFYQPTVQLLTSGFGWATQVQLRRGHVVGFLGLGSLMGIVAFSGHGWLATAEQVVWAIASLHLAAALALLIFVPMMVTRVVDDLDREKGGSRAMAMLALLSPRHFLVHALQWSNRKGGMHALPAELLDGLTAEPGREVVQTFYNAFPRLEEPHQLALVRLAAFLDRGADRDFLLDVAMEKVATSVRARRLAAHQLVKVLGKDARPILRRARGTRRVPGKRAA